MANPVIESAGYKNLSASALVRTGAGQLLGIFVASSSSGTVKLWDNTSAATTVIINTTSVAAGTFYPVPATFSTGLYVTIGGTADITVFFNPV
jgi:hypothetical protein